MRQRSMLNRLIGAVTIVALQVPFVAVAEPGTASLEGRVVARDGQSPLAGARVHVRPSEGADLFTSGWTAADGRFELSGLPAAEYRLAVEADGGLYIVEAPLALAPGQSRALHLAVNPDVRDDEDDDDTPVGALRGWSNSLTATLIVLGFAIGAGLLIDGLDGGGVDSDSASPSAP